MICCKPFIHPVHQLKILHQFLARMHENKVLVSCRMTENVLHPLNLLAHAQIGRGCIRGLD